MNFNGDPFLQALVARLDQPGVIGLAVVGSYARGENREDSDVDVDILMDEPPADKYTLRFLEGRLISLKYVLLADEYASLTRPERAIWAVPGIRHMQILLDVSGQLAALKQAAEDFEWEDLRLAAQQYAEEELMGCAEEAHKILSGLSERNESKVLYAVWGILKGLTSAVAAQRGLMIDSENRYFDIIQDSLGRAHAWTGAFRLALGAERGEDALPAYQIRGRAALELYKQTAFLFKYIITEKHREVIESTVRLIEEHRQTRDE